MKYSYEYPRPAMTADCVIFGFDGESLKILLIERARQPYLGMWALPGGFMKMDETIEECARRELREETHVRDIFLEQFHCFSGVDRDPRGRVVTVAFIALVRPSDHEVIGGDDAARAAWFNADALPPLAFDHREIIKAARVYLKEQLNLRPTAFLLLDEIFTIEELRRVYEVITQKTFDRRNFHRKLIKSEIVEEVPEDTFSMSGHGSPHLKEKGRGCCNEDVWTLPESTECLQPSSSPISATKTRSGRSMATKGRPPKFFRLISRLSDSKTAKANDEDEDNSIKNLFNF